MTNSGRTISQPRLMNAYVHVLYVEVVKWVSRTRVTRVLVLGEIYTRHRTLGHLLAWA